MSTCVYEQDLNVLDNEREQLIGSLRAALNAAESNQDWVTINFNGVEITWQFSDGEFFVIA